MINDNYTPPTPEEAVFGVELPAGELESIGLLMKVMARLRAADGCPWDRAQTHKTLLPNLLEEAYEYFTAVQEGDLKAMKEELGDLFLQIIFHSQIATERNDFTLGQASKELALKLIRRHPHVFGEKKASNSEEALAAWTGAKRREGEHTLNLELIPKAMPALLRARKIQEKAAKVGFEWSDIKGAMAKVEEELNELKRTIAQNDTAHAEDEIGDLLFAVVNVARYINHCPEVALTNTNEKFIRRFKFIETKLAEKGKTLNTVTLEEMDAIWEEAKRLEIDKS